MAGMAGPVIMELKRSVDDLHPDHRAKLEDVFYDFYSVGGHSSSDYLVLGKTAWAVVRVTDDRHSPPKHLIFCCRNQKHQHVERVVIEKLETELRYWARAPNQSSSSKTAAASSKSPTADPPPRSPDADPALSVDLFINYSPCNTCGCCRALKDFKAKHPNIRLTIIFSALYKINRSSCQGCYHVQKYPVSSEISEQNKKGLKLLLAPESGVTLRPFEDDDWRFLVSVLPMRRTVDRTMREDQDAKFPQTECTSRQSKATQGRMAEKAEPVPMDPDDRAEPTDAFFDFYSVGGNSASDYLVVRETTWVVVEVTYDRPSAPTPVIFYCRNQAEEQHAEQLAIKKLEEKPPHSVKLFINYYPCPECCQKLIDFKADHPKILTVVFSAPFNLNSSSCKSNKYATNQNEEGVLLLLAPESGVTLRPFEEADWRFLVSVLPMGRTADRIMRMDLEAICPPTRAGDACTRGDHSGDHHLKSAKKKSASKLAQK